MSDNIKPTVVHVDPARYGDGVSTIKAKGETEELVGWSKVSYLRGVDTVTFVGRVQDFVTELREAGISPVEIQVDTQGIGSAVLDQLHRLGYNAIKMERGIPDWVSRPKYYATARQYMVQSAHAARDLERKVSRDTSLDGGRTIGALADKLLNPMFFVPPKSLIASEYKWPSGFPGGLNFPLMSDLYDSLVLPEVPKKPGPHDPQWHGVLHDPVEIPLSDLKPGDVFKFADRRGSARCRAVQTPDGMQYTGLGRSDGYWAFFSSRGKPVFLHSREEAGHKTLPARVQLNHLQPGDKFTFKREPDPYEVVEYGRGSLIKKGYIRKNPNPRPHYIICDLDSRLVVVD